jgi:hypothetical protein
MVLIRRAPEDHTIENDA